MNTNYDVVIVGSGILGLSVAREYRRLNPSAKIAILEKESGLGKHGSGRNSGVLHSGIYYAENSLKAKFCATGARMLSEYCTEKGLPLAKIGKTILPIEATDDPTLDLLVSRAKVNGAKAYLIDAKELAKLEPLAYSISGRAAYVPDCSVIDSKAILRSLADELSKSGCQILFDHEVVSVDVEGGKIRCKNNSEISFGHFINAAGLFADRIAHMFGVGMQYAIMPFRGLYYDFVSPDKAKINGLLYPVPDLRLPFLGVHFTKSVEGKVYVGPNALPAMGRENYSGFDGVALGEAPLILGRNLRQYLKNEQGFRRLVKDEVMRLSKKHFVKAARAMVPTVQKADLNRESQKVGIRAQLYDRKEQRLVMDFLVDRGPKSTHILNAVSPGFTCGPSFASHLVGEFLS